LSTKNVFAANKQLRAERLQRGWSQQYVADELGITVVTVNRWERGVQQPTAYARLKLCTLFRKSEEELGLISEETQHTFFSLGSPEQKPESDSAEDATLHSDEEHMAMSREIVEHKDNLQKQKPTHPPLFHQRRALLAWGGVGLAITVAGSGEFVYWFTRSTSPLLYTYHDPSGASMYDVQWSPQGSALACVNEKQTVRVINALSETFQPALTSAATNCLAWSPDGIQVASPTSQHIRIWDSINGVDSLRIPSPGSIPECITWSSDGKCLAICGKDGMVGLWNATTGTPLLTYHGHRGTVWWIAWSPDNTHLASAGADGTVRLWSASSGKTILVYRGHSKAVFDVKWSPSGDKIASASEDRTVHIWDAHTGQTRLIYRGHKASVQAAEWSSDARSIASCSVDTTIQVWNTRTGACSTIYQGHTNTIWTLSWSFKRQCLASSSADGTVRVWRVNE
jgi:WD40 repeat protein/DNA-binding XRE family transcriptional regulator